MPEQIHDGNRPAEGAFQPAVHAQQQQRVPTELEEIGVERGRNRQQFFPDRADDALRVTAMLAPLRRRRSGLHGQLAHVDFPVRADGQRVDLDDRSGNQVGGHAGAHEQQHLALRQPAPRPHRQ